MKKLLTTLVMLMMLSITAVQAARTVYVLPNSWANYLAKLSLYVWSEDPYTTSWVDFEEEPTSDYILKAVIPDGYTKMIIVRHAGSTVDTHTFENKWNQTADLDVPAEDNLLYVLQEEGEAPANDISVGNGIEVKPYQLAEISKVEILGGFNDNWDSDGVNAELTGSDNVYSGVVNIHEYTGDYAFKLRVNDDIWLGNNELTIDAPEEWVSSTGDGENFILNTDKANYQTYTFTATWLPALTAGKGWTLKIEGLQKRPYNFDYEQVAISPVDHSQVDHLQNFTMTMPIQYTYEIKKDYGFVLLKNGDESFEILATAEVRGNLIDVKLPEKVTATGDYVLSILGGTITADGNELLPMSFKYTIYDKSKNFRDQITVDPEEGKVDYLEGIRIIFPAYIGGVYGQATLTNKTTGTKQNLDILDVNNKAVVGYNMPMTTEEGEYELLIPDGVIVFYNQGSDFQLGDLVFHYTIGDPQPYNYVIEEQPEGQLKAYSRNGYTRNEKIDDEGNVTIETHQQEGTISFVFADDNKVYIQYPVTDLYYDGWVEGTLSADGKTITVPVGQNVAYTKSLDMSVQIWMMKPGIVYFDGTPINSYEVDFDVTEILYTINEDGSIAIQNTDEDHILGAVNRAFGDTFVYLDFEWLGYGDYASVYTPGVEDVATPPAGLQTQKLIATTCVHDGMDWYPYKGMVRLGFDGDDVWLQGITDLLSSAWVKGTRNGSTLTFPSGQLLGYYNGYPLYLTCSVPDEQGNPVVGDAITFEYDGTSVYSSYNDIVIGRYKTEVTFINYFMGMTLSTEPDKTVTVPDDLQFAEYTLDYQEPDNNGNLHSKSYKVKAAKDGQQFYVQGITPILPESIIVGELAEDGTLTFQSPQFLGDYYDVDDTGLYYPFFFQTYNADNGTLLPTVAFSYNATTQAYEQPTAGICIGLTKTGIVALQYMFNVVLTPDETQGISVIYNAPTDNQPVYDLHGRRITTIVPGRLYIQGGRKFMSR